MSHVQRNLILLVLLVGIAFGLTFFAFRRERGALPAPRSFTEHANVYTETTRLPENAPALSTTTRKVLAKSQGFQALVSVTDRGFEPSDVSVARGQTIRFTNNGTENIRISSRLSESGDVYPGTSAECAASTFDTCVEIAPREFWEFTFDESGVWGYVDTLHAERKGVVRVR